LRQEHALQGSISYTYHKPLDKEEVFGEIIYQYIKAENESSKLLNDAAFQSREQHKSLLTTVNNQIL
jgi:hypothetical protein